MDHFGHHGQCQKVATLELVPVKQWKTNPLLLPPFGSMEGIFCPLARPAQEYTKLLPQFWWRDGMVHLEWRDIILSTGRRYLREHRARRKIGQQGRETAYSWFSVLLFLPLKECGASQWWKATLRTWSYSGVLVLTETMSSSVLDNPSWLRVKKVLLSCESIFSWKRLCACKHAKEEL